MMPVVMSRPVLIHQVFPILTHSLSSLCVACITVQFINSNIHIPYLCKLKGKGCIGLFNSYIYALFICREGGSELNSRVGNLFPNSLSKNKKAL